MKLLSLEMHNFRVIRSARLQFKDAIIGIIGPNGAGKSTIVEAIAFVLYGNPAARTGKEQIKSSFVSAGENCEVQLEFEIAREHYRVVRRLIGRTDKPEVLLFRDGSSESVGSTETRKQIEQLLGLDLKGFQTSFLARQQELNALSDLPVHKRREHLVGMLGIERLDKAIERIKADTRDAAVRVGTLERKSERDADLPERLAQLGEHVGILRVKLEAQLGARDKHKDELDRIAALHREHQTKKDLCSGITAQIQAVRATLEQMQRRVNSLQQESTKLQSAQAESDRLSQELDGGKAERRRFEELLEIDKVRQLADELRRQIDDLRKEVETTSGQAVEVSGLADRVANELSGLPSNPDELVKQAEESLEVARQNWTAVTADLNSKQNELSKLEQQLASIAAVGPETVCDRCHRPFGNDIPAITEHLTAERAKLVGEIATLSARREEVRQAGESQRTRLLELKQQKDRVRELRLKHKMYQQRVAELKTAEQKQRTELAALEQRLGTMGEVSFNADEFQRLKKRMDDLLQIERRAAELNGMLKRADNVRDEQMETFVAVEERKAQLVRHQDELARIGFDQQEFERTTHLLTEARTAFEVERDKTVELEKELEVTQRELSLGSERLDELRRLAEELEKNRTDQYYGEKLARLFAEFRTFTIAKIRPRLSELSGRLLSEMTDGRYNMIELDDNYNISILDATGFFEIDRFSGGEKDLANLCLRLAISEALTEAAGLDRSFMILDEVFGSQDNERRDLIFDGLVNLKNRFPQMLLITHIEEIKHKVENLVEVKRTQAGWSELIVDGSAV